MTKQYLTAAILLLLFAVAACCPPPQRYTAPPVRADSVVPPKRAGYLPAYPAYEPPAPPTYTQTPFDLGDTQEQSS